MKNLSRAVLAFVLAFCFSHPAFAEKIVLKSGTSLDHKIIKKTDNYVSIDYKGIPFPIFLEEIESIDSQKVDFSAVQQPPEAKGAQEYKKDFDAKDWQKYRGSVEARLKALDGALYLKDIEKTKDVKLVDKAVESYKEAIRLDPDSFQVYLLLGSLYSQLLGEYKKSTELYETAVKRIPQYSPLFYTLIGGNYLGMEDYARAKEYCKKALKLRPDDEKALYILGTVYYKLNDNAKAKESWQKALDLSNAAGDKQMAEAIKENLKLVE